ncbi:hypothetical protein ACFE04_006000 [Oxalis oulophora]
MSFELDDINGGDETSTDNESDGNEETDGLGNLSDGDDDDDDELQLARTSSLENNNSKSRVPLDLDDEAGSEDSYESDVEPPDSPRRRKIKSCEGEKSSWSWLPGTSSEYVIGEERFTNIDWENATRPSNILEWMAMTWPGIHVTPPNVVHIGTSSTSARKTTARKTVARKTPSQKASTSRASTSKVSRSKAPASKAPPSKAPTSKATTSKAPASKSPATTCKSLAPPPLSPGHAGFKRSGVLSITGRENWVTAAQIKARHDKERTQTGKGKEKVVSKEKGSIVKRWK